MFCLTKHLRIHRRRQKTDIKKPHRSKSQSLIETEGDKVNPTFQFLLQADSG